MAANEAKRGRNLSVERAREIWYPLISVKKHCEECGHPVVELQKAGIFQASPQRPDATKGYDEQILQVFCEGCQR